MRLLLALIALCWTACDDAFDPGLDEPIRVERATFVEGAVPDSTEEGSGDGLPRVTSVDLVSAIFYPNQVRRRISGRTTENATAIGIAIEDESRGAWVLPTLGLDVLAPGERSFEASATIGNLEPGLYRLVLVAFDAQRRAGPPRNFEICLASELPDNLNGCDRAAKPPAAIVTLTWNSQADVDLVLLGPGGEVLEARRPFGASTEGAIPAELLRDPTIPRFDRDSNADCRVDGRRRETVVFPEPPASGTWLIHARLTNACGASSVYASAEVLRRSEHGDGTWSLVSTGTAGTPFTADQVEQAGGIGTYLFSISF